MKTDKLLHFSIAYGATITACLINPWLVVIVALACIGKEVCDIRKRGFDKDNLLDLVADDVGILLGVIICGIL